MNLKDRQNQYGGPENNFERIAQMWNGYLGTNSIKPWDVAAMMGMLKMARARFNPKYADNWVDLAGYAACGAECAGAGIKPKADEEPKFKHGDRVQFSDEIPSTSEPCWFDGVYVERLPDGGHAVNFGPHGPVIHCSDKEIRHVPKAEGCEELVHDAPQTPEETCQRIVDSNPATYGQPRKPTGEELAEMAEEVPDGY